MLTNLLHQDNLQNVSFKLHMMYPIQILLQLYMLSNNSADMAGSALYGGNELEMCNLAINFQSVL